MKRIALLSILTLCCLTAAFAQTAPPTYLWPIEGAKPGTNILSQPQTYLNNELNDRALFVGAPEGTVVVAPADGTIMCLGVQYKMGIHTDINLDYDTSFDNSVARAVERLSNDYDPRYFGGWMYIRIADRCISIIGLRGDQTFKTGQKITRGTPIGRVGYSFHAIEEPSIGITVDKGALIDDPMTPFGLRTSFVMPGAIKPVLSLSKEKVKEDFQIYIDALKECYPGLYDVISPEELERYVARTNARIDRYKGDLPFTDIAALFEEGIARIHDSHIYLRGAQFKPTYKKKRFSAPQIWIGWFQDTLRCRNACEPYQHLIGREVKSFNGVSADSLKRKQIQAMDGYDAQVESRIEGKLAYDNISLFRDPVSQEYDYSIRLEMADGEILDVPALQADNRKSPVYSLQKFWASNYRQAGYELQILDSVTAYVGLNTFSLNQVAVEDIARFIDSIGRAEVPNLIFDVRNNGGGNGAVLNKLFSYIAEKPLILDGYSRVNKQGGYRSFRHSLNRLAEDSLFAGYRPEPGKEGYYSRPEAGNALQPDSSVRYKGRVYVLTNENSTSAATLLPAMVVRSRRGVTVGRETRTAYHFMNAVKFADICMPNSTITVTLPLVYCVFDTVVNNRVPYGRGVLPDYEVPISIEELSFEKGDAILNHTLQLIKEDKYFPAGNPFDAEADEVVLRPGMVLGMASLPVILLLFFGFRYFHRKTATKQ